MGTLKLLIAGCVGGAAASIILSLFGKREKGTRRRFILKGLAHVIITHHEKTLLLLPHSPPARGAVVVFLYIYLTVRFFFLLIFANFETHHSPLMSAYKLFLTSEGLFYL